jgi:chloramphenicol 3-O phosphotransferase
MVPEEFKPSSEADSTYVERVHLGFEYSIPALARAGNRLLVGHPFYHSHSLRRCLDLVSEYSVLYVGVFCPVDILEQRETARGDRRIGLARRQSAIVHENSEYDIEIDTHQLTPKEAAQRVVSALRGLARPPAFVALG